MKHRGACRRRIRCLILLALFLPPLFWLFGTGTRPDVSLLTLLPPDQPIRLNVTDPGRLRDILFSPSTTKAHSIFERYAFLPSPCDDDPAAAFDSLSTSSSCAVPLDAGMVAPSTPSASSIPMRALEESLALRFLYGRLTAFALTHDPGASFGETTTAVFTVDNLGQALLRVALPLLADASGDGYRMVIGGTPFAILHEGGSLFRIGARPSRVPVTTEGEAFPETVLGMPDTQRILELRIAGSVFAAWPELEHAISEFHVSLVDASRVARLILMVDGRLPPAIASRVPSLASRVRTRRLDSVAPGLRIDFGASLDELRRCLWAWQRERETVPRTGVALPWESDLDAVLQDLVATSDGESVSVFVRAPPPQTPSYGVPPVPQVVLVWRAHPDAERVALHLDRAMQRFARSVREFSFHPLEQRVLGQTAWIPDATGAPGGTVTMHPLFFHHLAPTVAVHDGHVFLTTIPEDPKTHLWDVNGALQPEGETTPGGGVGIAWQTEAALQACLVDVVRDCLIRKAWVSETDHFHINRIVAGVEALLQVWPVFTIQIVRGAESEPARVRVVGEVLLP